MMDDALVPTFSRAERDRRWGLVRRRMMDERLDCLSASPTAAASSSFRRIRGT